MSTPINVGPLSGFPERLPAARIAELELTDRIRHEYELVGFTPLETPAVERLEVLTSKGGIQRQIYELTRPETDGGDRGQALGLHFDLTVPLARFVVAHETDLQFPLRRWQHQKVWRGERPQHGRAREFAQFDIDIVGREELDPLHDAEILATVARTLEAIGLPDAVVHVSHRGVLQTLTDHFGVPAPAILALVDKVPRDGLDATLERIAALGVPAALLGALGGVLQAQHTAEVAERFEALGVPVDGVESLRRIVDAAIALGTRSEQLRLDFTIARGLDYYTGLVAETFVPGCESWGSICSGGRYDNLAAHFGARQFPGVGVSIGVTRLFDLLADSGRIELARSSPASVLIATQDREQLPVSLSIARDLRAAGHATELYLQPRPLRDQLADAAAKGIRLVVIAGRELREDRVVLRDMHRREQDAVPLDLLLVRVGEALDDPERHP